MNKRILLLSENFPPIEGGSARWFWELYTRLPRKNVVILAHDVVGATAFDKNHDLNIMRACLRNQEWGVKSLSGLRFYWRCFWNVRKIIKQNNIDEVHCGRVIHEGITAWLINKIMGIPFVCFVHGEDVETAATSREQSLLVKQVCKASRRLICNSHNSAQLCQKLEFAKLDKCEVLHPGVDIEKFKPAKPDQIFQEKMGWSGKNVLLTVGRLQQRKGQDYLIKAMPQLLKQHPNLHYAIVGRGECEASLRQLITEYRVDAHVSLNTELDDAELVQCYQQCDVFILPNRTIDNDIEGFGMVLVEAQACGKPVIAGDSGGTKETMEIDNTGFIIDCSSPEAITKGLSGVLKSLEAKPIGNRAFHHAKNQFNWEQHVEKAKRLFSIPSS